MKTKLFVWNWVGGGYNQTHATSKEEALEKAKKIWDKPVDLSTLKGLDDKEEQLFWKNYPMFD